jgi:hypothetical protein
MKYLIEGTEVVQYLQIPEDLIPHNLKVADGDDSSDISQVYYDPATDNVKLKPPRPSDRHEWGSAVLAWVEREEEVTQPGPDPSFMDLFDSFRGTAIWDKIKMAGATSLRLNLAVTMLVTALTASKNKGGLQDAIAELRAGLDAEASTTDFTTEEISQINTLLSEHGFDFHLT